jgi:hypothetical protein
MGGYGLDSSGSRRGPVMADSCENGNEPLGSIKGGEFLDVACSLDRVQGVINPPPCKNQ